VKYASVLLACLFITPALAEWRVDATGGVAYQHQVIELPQDQGKLYCTIFGGDSQARELANWFDTCPELRQVKQATHFAVMSSNSTMFKSRYDATTGDLPCIRIQDASGNTIYQCSGRNLPLSPDALANSISTTCLRRRNVDPQPSPYNIHLHYAVTPDVKPDVTPKQPDVYMQPDEWPASHVWTLAIAGVASVLGGVAWQWKKSYEE
jgi:hypothetical protein